MFANARFVSPVTQDKVSQQERFQITVDVTPATQAKATPGKTAPAPDLHGPATVSPMDNGRPK